MAYRIIPIFVPHEGCPHNCVFCNQRKIAQDTSVSAADVENTLSVAFENSDCVGAEIAFYGGSFTAIDVERQEELLSAAAPYIEKGLSSGIRISTRPDCIDETCLKRLKRFGVHTIELGAQSMCDDVLLKAGRGHTAKDVCDASKLIKAHGFHLGLQVMTGLPSDTLDKTIETAEETAALSPDFVRIYPVVVVTDTPLYDMWKAGQYTPLTVSEAADRAGAMLEIFLNAHIDVIRIGLNPNEELSGGGAVAGGYHPALGEMARSRVYRQKAEELLSPAKFNGGEAVLTVGKGCTSLMTGIKRENITYLIKTYGDRCGFSRITIREDDALARYEVKCST